MDEFPMNTDLDPTGYQVRYRYMGSYKLGDVRGFRRAANGIRTLIVHHFNGEQWTDYKGRPLEPRMGAVEVIG